MSEPPIKVLLVDDQELVRTGFRLVLDLADDIVVVGEASSGDDAVHLLTSEVEADVVCMDVRMPGTDGIEAARRLAEIGIGSRILMLTTFDVDEYVYDALAAGACGFLLKDCGAADLASGIRTVHSGEAVLSPQVTSRLIARFRPQLASPGAAIRRTQLEEVLSPRELEILQAVGRGMSNQEIAAAMYLAETTVKSHIGRLFTKLDVRDRVGLVIKAYDASLVTSRS